MAGKKILLVEDDEEMIEIFSLRLEINGYEVVKVRDGQEALVKIKSEQPHLILLDLMIPKISGFDVCRMIKFDDETKGIPVIILSALGSERDKAKIMANGADAFFTKPFDFQELLNKIKSTLG